MGLSEYRDLIDLECLDKVKTINKMLQYQYYLPYKGQKRWQKSKRVSPLSKIKFHLEENPSLPVSPHKFTNVKKLLHPES